MEVVMTGGDGADGRDKDGGVVIIMVIVVGIMM